MKDIQSTLVELEKGFWKAAGSDGAYYQKHFLNDGIMVLPFKGGILNKEQTIAMVLKADPWQAFTINNPQLLSISEDLHILIYEAQGKRNGESLYTALISSHYKQQDNGWQLAFHQQTPFSS